MFTVFSTGNQAEKPKNLFHNDNMALSPDQEENFRQNLDDLLAQLDAKTDDYREEEERKITRLEGRKNLYLEHAEEMGKKSRGNVMTIKLTTERT